MKIMIINGPNLNMTGIRDKGHYGTRTFDEVMAKVRETGETRGHDMTIFQSNHEGDIIDQFHKAYFENFDGIIYCAGAHLHNSYAIADAIVASEKPVISVSFTNLYKRALEEGEYRRVNVTAPVCVGYIAGLGAIAYVLAIQGLEDVIKNKES